MFCRRRTGIRGDGARGGFSLVEVALALTVAAGGMISIFGLFPAGLRQGANSSRDLVSSSFAGATLAAIAGNVAAIDDIATWNKPEEWWKRAIENTNLPAWNKGRDPDAFRGDSRIFRPNVPKVADSVTNNASGSKGSIWFFADDDGKRDVTPSGIALPPHYIIRLVRVRRRPRPLDYRAVRGYVNAVERYGKMYGSRTSSSGTAENMLVGKGQKVLREPDRYIVSIVSSDQKGYSIFVNEPVYSQEFHFLHRP